MKSIKIGTICILLSLGAQAQYSGINFKNYSTWNQIVSDASKKNKKIFIDVYATWCSPCQKMEQEVYSNDTIYSFLNDKFISIKLQIDTSKSDSESTKKRYQLAREIVHKFNIKAVPSFLFFDQKGDLIHRESGFYTVQNFKAICKLSDSTNGNYQSVMRSFKKGQLGWNEMNKLSLYLKRCDEDSLAILVARKAKDSFLNSSNPDTYINGDLPFFFGKFQRIFYISDPFIKYIYKNKSTTDDKTNSIGFSEGVVDYVVTKDILEPTISKMGNKQPSWDMIEKSIANSWDSSMANRIVLNRKIKWYTVHEDWENAIKFQMEKIDNMNPNFGSWEAFSINNFIWDIVFKHSNDMAMLKKACHYMQIITKSYPDDHAKLDTYANLLYKTGEKEKAIETEKTALSLAQKANDQELSKVFLDTIDKMKKNKPTWE